jgi:hypothetical protein
MKLKNKLQCLLKRHVVWDDEWDSHWSDGEEWDTNICLRCGKEIVKDEFGYSDRVKEIKFAPPFFVSKWTK